MTITNTIFSYITMTFIHTPITNKIWCAWTFSFVHFALSYRKFTYIIPKCKFMDFSSNITTNSQRSITEVVNYNLIHKQFYRSSIICIMCGKTTSTRRISIRYRQEQPFVSRKHLCRHIRFTIDSYNKITCIINRNFK